MTTISWKTNASGDWNTASNWLGNIVPGTLDTAFISTASAQTIMISAGTDKVAGLVTASTDLVSVDGGTLNVTGTATVAGGLSISGGLATFGATAPAIASAIVLSGGTLLEAGGKTLTLPGPVTWDGGDVAGSGTLATTGTTTISNAASPAYIDGGLTWTNSGTVLDNYYVYVDTYQTSSTLANKMVNQATGVFNFTSDGFVAFYDYTNTAPVLFSNAGLLEKTSGIGGVSFYATLTNTGTIAVGSGTLELDNGGTLGGTVSLSATGTLALTTGAFSLTNGVVTGGTVLANGGTITLGGAAQTIASAVVLSGGAVSLGSGKTLTLTGPVSWSSGDVAGPGTLATTGTTTINGSAGPAYIDGGLTWTNSGTVLDSYVVYVGAIQSSSTLTDTIVNQASGVFNFIADGFAAFYDYGNTAPVLFSNAGLLEKTAGAGAVDVYATLTSTGTISVTSGTLELDSGGTLGGVMGASGSGHLAFNAGIFTLARATQSITGAATLSGGTLSIAGGDTLTLSGPVTWNGGDVAGPGTLATTGTTTLSTAYIDGGLTWTNSGTVLDSGYIYINQGGSTVATNFVNQAGGVFRFTADGYHPFNAYGTTAQSFANAGLLQKSAGTGTLYFDPVLTNTGTVTATSGTLELDGGGTLAGTIGGTGSGVVQLGGGSFVTTGTLAILDAGIYSYMRVINGVTWTDSGVINDGGHLLLSNNTGGTLAITAAGHFNFTSDDGAIVTTSGAAVTNAGLIAKTGGAGTSSIGGGVTNSGTIDAASGTLKLNNGIAGAGRLQVEAGKTLELGSGGLAGNNTLDLNGLAATLKIDTNSTVNKPIIGLTTGRRIDLAAAGSATAVINGATLAITPVGGSALNFVGTTSLANLHATTGSDGASGTVVTLYSLAAASTQPVAFGTVHVGDTLSRAVSVTNSAPSGAYTENLDGALSASAPGFTAAGSFSGLAGGATNSSALTVTLNTASAGIVSGTGTLALASDGASVDGFATTALPSQTISVTGIVDNYATSAIQSVAGVALGGSGTSYRLDLGTVAQGGAAASATLDVANTATGPADLLSGAFTAGGASGFSNSGFVTFSGVAAGQVGGPLSIALATTTAGVFTETIVLTPTGSNASGYSGVLAAETLSVTGTISGVYTLTTGADTITGTVANDSVIAASGAVSAGDRIDGGAGTNTLTLQGGGIFNEALPTTLANVQVVQAQEGSGANAQTLVLRSGLTQTVNVGSGGAGTGITINAGVNGSTINLGSGADTVTLGSTAQHVLGGSGADRFNVTAATIGATIDGGTGASVLALSGGGTATMGASITRIASATLGGATPYNFTANAIAGLTINDGGGANTITLGAATQVVNAQGGAIHVLATAAFAGAKVLGATGSVLEITTGGTATLNQNTGGVTVQLDAATNLTLSKATFITAIGSAGNDGITALAANQTLTGGAGTDTLVGFTGGNDMFRDSTAGLGGDTITNWVSGDTIDLTDMSYASVQPLSYAGGKLTVSDGTHTASTGFTGSLATHNFTLLGADSGGGTLIGWHS